MRGVPAICAAALLALAVPVLAPAQQPRGGQLSIQAAPQTVTFGQATAISGRLRGGGNEGVTVALEANPHPYAGFSEVATTLTNARGDYSFRVAPDRHTRYRAVTRRADVDTSRERLVEVRMRVGLRLSDATPRRGALVRFSGSVAPAHDGRIARIQRRTGTGDFRTVARTLLRDAGDTRSAYSRRLRVRRTGVYRVLVPADADHATGTSRARSIRVR